jgi:hypothetical protein
LPPAATPHLSCFYEFAREACHDESTTADSTSTVIEIVKCTLTGDQLLKQAQELQAKWVTEKEAREFLEHFGYYYCNTEHWGGVSQALTVKKNKEDIHISKHSGGISAEGGSHGSEVSYSNKIGFFYVCIAQSQWERMFK